MVMIPEDLIMRIDNQWYGDPSSERELVEYDLGEIMQWFMGNYYR
jgi:hypothetical protein